MGHFAHEIITFSTRSDIDGIANPKGVSKKYLRQDRSHERSVRIYECKRAATDLIVRRYSAVDFHIVVNEGTECVEVRVDERYVVMYGVKRIRD